MTRFVFEGYQIGYTFFGKRPFIKDIRRQKTYFAPFNVHRCYQDFIKEVQRRNMPQDAAEFVIEYTTARYIATVTMPGTFAASLFIDTPPGKFVDNATMALDPTNWQAFGAVPTTSPQPPTATPPLPSSPEFDYKVTLNARSHLKVSHRSKVAIVLDENGQELSADKALYDRYRNVRREIVCTIEDDARRLFLLFALDTTFADAIRGNMFERDTLCRRSNHYIIGELDAFLTHERRRNLT